MNKEDLIKEKHKLEFDILRFEKADVILKFLKYLEENNIDIKNINSIAISFASKYKFIKELNSLKLDQFEKETDETIEKLSEMQNTKKENEYFSNFKELLKIFDKL